MFLTSKGPIHKSCMKWCSVLMLCLSFLEVFSQDKTAEVDKIFNWATSNAPGCACAVSQNGKQVLNKAYGSADLERDVPISPNTVFDAGSLTKQFVAAVTLLLVEEGKLALTDDVRKYITALPDYGHTITINHLLTHTSGLRDWSGIMPFTNRSVDAMAIILRQQHLNFKPGEEWWYSNSGYVLLKEIIGKVSGMAFSEFSRKRIFDPLGMKFTSYKTSLRDVVKNRAVAYDKEGNRWTMAMQLDNDRGGGGALFTTATDLLIWNEAITNAGLGKFVSDKLQEQTILNNGRKINYGRGLYFETYRGAKEIWHTGSADGYKSWLGRYPEHNLSIAIMCNSGDGTNRTAFARKIFDLYVPELSQQGKPANSEIPPVDTAVAELNTKTGTFFNSKTGEPLRLTVDRDRFRIVGGPGLQRIGKDRFKRFAAFAEFMSQDEFEIQFLPDGDFDMISMEGVATRYHRAKTFAPKSAQLADFAGAYSSAEMGTTFYISVEKNSLMMRLEHSGGKSAEVKPIDVDVFQLSRMTIRFLRDKKGKVVAFDYSNPLLRNVKFTRIG